ncbi:hypothetical protein MTO96_005258 [Rhipicephalus appendiculatus]
MMSQAQHHDASADIQGQLDLDRPCGAVSSDEACWLCEDFEAWNTVIRALYLELAETAPGTLRLRFDPDVPSARWNEEYFKIVAREASIVLSSLLPQHLCIRELDLNCVTCCVSAADPLFPISMRRQSSSPASRTLRSLRISYFCGERYIYGRLHMPDMDAVIGLETLYVYTQHFNERWAAEIDALLERNRTTLNSVEMFFERLGRHKLRMVEHLAACKFLKLGSLDDSEIEALDVDGMVSLLRGSTTLKEAAVRLIGLPQVSLIAKALETNCCLTKLSLDLKWSASIEQLFGAIEVNKHLKELFLVASVHVNMTSVRAVASALMKNNCLRTLDMATTSALRDGVGLRLWSEALSKNVTLHTFRLHHYTIPISEVSTLCKALRVNKSLKALKLTEVTGSEEDSTSLARQLLEDECYDRVQLGHLTEPYLRVLAPVLASPEAGTSEICLSNVCDLSHETASVLFSALASNKKVQRLTVAVWNEPDLRVTLLCDTLRNNQSIRFLCICPCESNSANDILRALTVNSSITELDMRLVVDPSEETMTALSDMLSRNNTITKISVFFYCDNPRPLLEAYAQGMSVNRLILDCLNGLNTGIPPSLFVPLRRNRAALNRAIEFILERREDRRCVECFELFFGRSCLITKLMEIGGMSDVEARTGVAAAENRRREKYLVLAGVVRRSVACWPADVTQIDALNCDCWRAIARYLNVSDISS